MKKTTVTRSDDSGPGLDPAPEDVGSDAGANVPDPAQAIARVRAARAEGGSTDAPRRGRGRPKGSKTKKTAPGRSSRAGDSEDDDAPPEVTPADIQGAAFLGSVVWAIGGKFLHCRKLNDEEKQQFGEALAPVLVKYLPAAGAYAPEIGLALTVWGLYETTKEPKAEPAPDGEAALGDGLG